MQPISIVEPAGTKADEAVEELAHDMARVLRRVPPRERQELREYAAELVRSEADGEPTRLEPPKRDKRGALLGVGLLMLAIGLGLMLLVPPVGTVITILGLVMLLLGGAGTIAKQVTDAIRRFRQDPDASDDGPAVERESRRGSSVSPNENSGHCT